jgi:hypothetical protein
MPKIEEIKEYVAAALLVKEQDDDGATRAYVDEIRLVEGDGSTGTICDLCDVQFKPNESRLDIDFHTDKDTDLIASVCVDLAACKSRSDAKGTEHAMLIAEIEATVKLPKA